MTQRTAKLPTDEYWNERAATFADHRAVNIHDLAQRRLENEFILAAVRPADRLLEVGCGNGYLTSELRQRASFVDAFDFAENMIASAKQTVGEHNNRFFIDSILSPQHVSPPYDSVVCVRVLINLASFEEQRSAIQNMAQCLQEAAG
jgi:2-polyprenyl-3-methyl-5-hydroxy-6-metoxy-1,4-benzoquinol methylase